MFRCLLTAFTSTSRQLWPLDSYRGVVVLGVAEPGGDGVLEDVPVLHEDLQSFGTARGRLRRPSDDPQFAEPPRPLPSLPPRRPLHEQVSWRRDVLLLFFSSKRRLVALEIVVFVVKRRRRRSVLESSTGRRSGAIRMTRLSLAEGAGEAEEALALPAVLEGVEQQPRRCRVVIVRREAVVVGVREGGEEVVAWPCRLAAQVEAEPLCQ
mmetsp:Transcript_193/g.561  ORF Transcript_193/g.561 Transcript_193/m.561 type:complete len:209 (-) Transcript_193:616-1242(-)